MTRDPGLQPERTSLAWTRTAWLMTANAFLVVRAGLQSEGVPLLVLGVVMVGCSMALHVFGERRDRQLAEAAQVSSMLIIGATAAATCIAAVATGVALVTS